MWENTRKRNQILKNKTNENESRQRPITIPTRTGIVIYMNEYGCPVLHEKCAIVESSKTKYVSSACHVY